MCPACGEALPPAPDNAQKAAPLEEAHVTTLRGILTYLSGCDLANSEIKDLHSQVSSRLGATTTNPPPDASDPAAAYKAARTRAAVAESKLSKATTKAEVLTKQFAQAKSRVEDLEKEVESQKIELSAVRQEHTDAHSDLKRYEHPASVITVTPKPPAPAEASGPPIDGWSFAGGVVALLSTECEALAYEDVGMDEGLAAAKTEIEVAAVKFTDLRKQAIAKKGQGKGKLKSSARLEPYSPTDEQAAELIARTEADARHEAAEARAAAATAEQRG